MALISYVTNSAKAIWSAIAHPLSIIGKKNCNVADYKIYGGGKNLLNVKELYPDFANDNGGITLHTGQLYTFSSSQKRLEGVFKENTRYTFSLHYNISEDTETSIIPQFWYTDGTKSYMYIGVGTGQNRTGEGDVSITSYAGRTVSYFNFTYGTNSKRYEAEFSNIQIEEGTSATEYEPYQYTDNFPITVRGKNILDMSKQTVLVGYYTDGAGAPNGNSRFVRISSIAVKPSTTYTISSNLFFYNIWFYKSLSNSDGISGVSASKTQKKTFTTPEGCAYIRVSMDLKMTEQEAEGVSAFEWAMLELGEGDGIYEPYIEPQTVDISLDEPLGAGEVIQQSVDDLPNLPQYKGTTVYEVQTDTPPSGIEVCYYE